MSSDITEEKSWFNRKENWLIIGGSIIAVGAICVPFFIMKITDQRYKLESFANLGTLGDYFGGTTVGLLSLASIIFVTAAIVMQKEELSLQRIEIKKTREEYEITNTTMKKQQFDSTFFNMINLHHNILSEISYNENRGRDAIKLIYEELKISFNNEVYDSYSIKLKNEALKDHKEFLDDLLRESYIVYHRNIYINEYESNNFHLIDFDEFGETDTTEFDSYAISVVNGGNVTWNKEEQVHIEYFNENIRINANQYSEWLELLDFRKMLNSNISNMYIEKFKNEFIENPLKELKSQAFETVYKKNENLLGHYFRNLYRIVKIIQEEEFHIDKEKNENEKKKYRGILRAQLSSYELIIIFYNVNYSNKGKNFQEILKNTNFFDDHLVLTDFIWRNDLNEMKKMESV